MGINAGRRRVVMPVLDGCPVFDLAVPCEVFGRDRRVLVPEWYELVLCQATPGQYTSSVPGLLVQTHGGLDALDSADLIVVPPPPDPA